MSPSNEEGATGIDNSNSIEDSLPGVRVNPARQRYQPRLRRLVVGSGIPQTIEPEDAAVAPHVRPLAMLDRPGLGPRQGRDDKSYLYRLYSDRFFHTDKYNKDEMVYYSVKWNIFTSPNFRIFCLKNMRINIRGF